LPATEKRHFGGGGQIFSRARTAPFPWIFSFMARWAVRFGFGMRIEFCFPGLRLGPGGFGQASGRGPRRTICAVFPNLLEKLFGWGALWGGWGADSIGHPLGQPPIFSRLAVRVSFGKKRDRNGAPFIPSRLVEAKACIFLFRPRAVGPSDYFNLGATLPKQKNPPAASGHTGSSWERGI